MRVAKKIEILLSYAVEAANDSSIIKNMRKGSKALIGNKVLYQLYTLFSFEKGIN